MQRIGRIHKKGGEVVETNLVPLSQTKTQEEIDKENRERQEKSIELFNDRAQLGPWYRPIFHYEKDANSYDDQVTANELKWESLARGGQIPSSPERYASAQRTLKSIEKNNADSETSGTYHGKLLEKIFLVACSKGEWFASPDNGKYSDVSVWESSDYDDLNNRIDVAMSVKIDGEEVAFGIDLYSEEAKGEAEDATKKLEWHRVKKILKSYNQPKNGINKDFDAPLGFSHLEDKPGHRESSQFDKMPRYCIGLDRDAIDRIKNSDIVKHVNEKDQETLGKYAGEPFACKDYYLLLQEIIKQNEVFKESLADQKDSLTDDDKKQLAKLEKLDGMFKDMRKNVFDSLPHNDSLKEYLTKYHLPKDYNEQDEKQRELDLHDAFATMIDTSESRDRAYRAISQTTRRLKNLPLTALKALKEGSEVFSVTETISKLIGDAAIKAHEKTNKKANNLGELVG